MTGNEKGKKLTVEILVESDRDRNVEMEMKLCCTASQNVPQTTIIMEMRRDHMAERD